MIETVRIEEPRPSSHAEQIVHENCHNDEDEDPHICEINATNHYRLCKAQTAHDLVLCKPDASLAQKHYQLWLLLI